MKGGHGLITQYDTTAGRENKGLAGLVIAVDRAKYRFDRAQAELGRMMDREDALSIADTERKTATSRLVEACMELYRARQALARMENDSKEEAET